MKEFNSNQFREMYQRMGVDIDKLGCIMLDLDNSDNDIPAIPESFGDDVLFTTTHPERFILAEFVKSKTMETEIPRRNRLDLNTPAELAIYHAMQEVEKAGADVRLTEAINLLKKAKDLVSDCVDGVCNHAWMNMRNEIGVDYQQCFKCEEIRY